MLGTQSSAAGIGRRERQALRHVSRYWIPLNAHTCTRLLEGFERGAYDLDRSSLIEELEEDFGLYSLVCKQLGGGRWKNPLDALSFAPMDQIRDAVALAAETNSQELSQESEEKIQALGVSVLANQITKACARKLGCDERLAHAVSLFRVLGMLLVHWNYASLMARRPSHMSADAFASQELGFSANMLGLLFAREWGFDNSFCALIGGGVSTDVDQRSLADIRSLCLAGEALAQANSPELYPSIPENFGDAQGYLRSHLGESFVEFLNRELGRVRLDYESMLENFTMRFLALSIEERRHSRDECAIGDRRSERVSRALSLDVRSKIEGLYKGWRPKAVHSAAVQVFLREIFPACGCFRGAVLILDPTTMMLIPRALIGSAKASDYGTIDYAPNASSDSLIASAFRSYSLLTQGNLPREEGRCAGFALGLGKERRAGVLYLEFAENQAPPAEVLKALRNNLADFLGLS